MCRLTEVVDVGLRRAPTVGGRPPTFTPDPTDLLWIAVAETICAEDIEAIVCKALSREFWSWRVIGDKNHTADNISCGCMQCVAEGSAANLVHTKYHILTAS